MTENNHVIIHVHRPGFKEKFFFLFSGIIVSIPLTLFVNSFQDHLCLMLPIFYAQLCSSSIFVPFIEEFAKVYPLFYRHGETGKSIFSLGFLVGMGFGITEFFLYVFEFGAPAFIRFPLLFFHAASTSITAYGIATKQPVAFYLIAVALHLSNNIFASAGALWLIGGPVALGITFLLSWQLYFRTSERIVD